MEMKKIETIWLDLESDESNLQALLYKRYSAEVLPDIFVALKSPERFRCIAFKISNSYLLEENQWNKFRDIKIELFPDSNKTKKFLLILLLNGQHKEIFSTLSEDLIWGVADVSSEQVLLQKLLERLTKWQLLFEKIGKQGLSDEAQRGLFGELYFLRIFLESSIDKSYCINSWRGPEKAIQDFQYSTWAVEVKTTHGNNHQKIHISSERQLDDSIVARIFLFHLSLDIREGTGESLNSLIDQIFNILTDSPIALNQFRLKLLEYGFYEIHRPFYEDRGYVIRQESIYRVTGNFPRITESQIPMGVGDVKYSIVLSESEDWKIEESTLLSELKLT